MPASTETAAAARHDRAIAGPSAGAVGTGADGARPLPFALAIFVSAFLLFQVQLLNREELQHLFGGAPAVWTVCVRAVQILFLGGYGYARSLVTWLAVRRQVPRSGALLKSAAVFLIS